MQLNILQCTGWSLQQGTIQPQMSVVLRLRHLLYTIISSFITQKTKHASPPCLNSFKKVTYRKAQKLKASKKSAQTWPPSTNRLQRFITQGRFSESSPLLSHADCKASSPIPSQGHPRSHPIPPQLSAKVAHFPQYLWLYSLLFML